MENVLSALVGLLFWRVILWTFGSVALAFLLAKFFPSFTAGYCVTLVILGFTFGAYWQSRAGAGLGIAEDVPEPQISLPVAFLGFAFVGLVWGGVAITLFGSRLVAIVVLLLGAMVVALWYRFQKHKALSAHALAFALASLFLGFLPMLFIGGARHDL